jgi:hypothetical protein
MLQSRRDGWRDIRWSRDDCEIRVVVGVVCIVVGIGVGAFL